ncbi:MAG: hypothetical protein U0L26_08060 [Cellulosilyticum sp.]|nr:hypothetical protein [Cellulosilyticum sp.]
MREDLIETNLEARVIEREGDQDFFIETFLYPMNFEIDIPYMSRIQFPMPRAVLIRTTPISRWVTVHVLRDIDLFSSFANFELDLTDKKLVLKKEEGYIRLYLRENM